jgi:hypothetical protein
MQLLLWNVKDRDFRDILFDHRVTSAGREFQHPYFKETWWTIVNWQWPSPSLASQLSKTVPVMLLECDDGLHDSCDAVYDLVQAAMGIEPRHCPRRGGLFWINQVVYKRRSGVVKLRFFADGEELSGHELTTSGRYGLCNLCTILCIPCDVLRAFMRKVSSVDPLLLHGPQFVYAC